MELYVDDVKVAEDMGEIQYTDYGISGIPVFQISRYAVKALDEKKERICSYRYASRYKR